MPSKALEVNIEQSRVDVTISEKYGILREVMSPYDGIMEGLDAFLTELCHPYKNWRFIVKEARGYVLGYFHLLKTHSKGPEAAKIFIEIFLEAVEASQSADVKSDAADNLLVFLQKIIKDAGDEFVHFMPVLDLGFRSIHSLENEDFDLFVRSYYQINRLAGEFQEKASSDNSHGSINPLLIKYLGHSYVHWLEEEDPFEWFTKETSQSATRSGTLWETFRPISHNHLRRYRDRLESAVRKEEQDSVSLLEALIQLPGYRQIVDFYRDIPQKLLKAEKEPGQGRYWKLIFLFHIMKNAGLSSIHEEALRDINRILTWLIDQEKPEDLQPLIRKTFDILKKSVLEYPGTALNCVLNMGKAVYKTDESDLVDFFMEAVVDLGFQYPNFKGVGDDWRTRINAAHIQNIRTWLELIELNPTWSKKLLSSLIIHLSLGGVFIRDTDLFSRDITGFLNTDITLVYNLVKQLTRLFPAYFNDIGAEGELREISTEIDEVCSRKDVLIHFLRKQSHVESSNQIINLMEATLEFWRTREKRGFKPFIPSSIYEQIETEGPYVDGVHALIVHLIQKKG